MRFAKCNLTPSVALLLLLDLNLPIPRRTIRALEDSLSGLTPQILNLINLNPLLSLNVETSNSLRTSLSPLSSTVAARFVLVNKWIPTLEET